MQANAKPMPINANQQAGRRAGGGRRKDGWRADKPCFGEMEPCTVGLGDVDVAACVDVLRGIDYQGFIALEYEGPDDERKGVEESLDFMYTVLRPDEAG